MAIRDFAMAALAVVLLTPTAGAKTAVQCRLLDPGRWNLVFQARGDAKPARRLWQSIPWIDVEYRLRICLDFLGPEQNKAYGAMVGKPAVEAVASPIFLSLWIFDMRRLSIKYRREAEHHEQFEAVCRTFHRSFVNDMERQRKFFNDRLELEMSDPRPNARERIDAMKAQRDEAVRSVQAEVDKCARLAGFHSRLGKKYESAARRPWIHLPPDPHAP